MHKKSLFLTPILLFSLFFSGCTEIFSVEKLSYVIAIGIDECDSNEIRLSLQFAIPSNSSGDSSTSQSSEARVITVNCSSIDSGINLINSYISKKINLSHCKAVVFSEIIAEQGVSDHIYSILNNVEIRPNCNVLISRCSAEIFLNRSTPELESHTARYYETIKTTNQNTGFSVDVDLFDFYSKYKSDFIQPIATLVGLNMNSTHISETNSPYLNIDGEYKADETPIKAKSNAENMVTAVFYDDKLVGELNGIETVCHLLVSNDFKNATISIASPFDENSQVSVYISQRRKTKRTIKIVNGSPYISINAYLSANILSNDISADFSHSDSFHTLNQYVNKFFENQISTYLYKTAKDLNTDIDGFGTSIRRKYLTFKDIDNINWTQNYKNAFFDCDVDCTVEAGFVLLKS